MQLKRFKQLQDWQGKQELPTLSRLMWQHGGSTLAHGGQAASSCSGCLLAQALRKRCNSISRKTGKGGVSKCPWSLGTCRVWASLCVGDRILLACHCRCQACSLWSLLCMSVAALLLLLPSLLLLFLQRRQEFVCMSQVPKSIAMQQQVNKRRVSSPCRRRDKAPNEEAGC